VGKEDRRGKWRRRIEEESGEGGYKRKVGKEVRRGK